MVCGNGDWPFKQTNNLEWYDPSAITTQDGYLMVTLSQKETHNLNYQGGEYLLLYEVHESFCLFIMFVPKSLTPVLHRYDVYMASNRLAGVFANHVSFL